MRLRKIINEDPYYKFCARSSEECSGRLTCEHALTYAGRQVNDLFAIIPLCEYHHLGKGLNKLENRRIAVSRATVEDLAKYPRADWSVMYRKP